MQTKIFSLKISQKVIVHLFQETKFCHICLEQVQETMNPPSVVLEVIKGGMQLTCQASENPKVISLCWYRGKGKDRILFSALQLLSKYSILRSKWYQFCIENITTRGYLCSKSLRTISRALRNAKWYRQIMHSDALGYMKGEHNKVSLPTLVILCIYSSADSWLSCQNEIVLVRRKINDFTIKIHYNILICIDSCLLYYLTSKWRIDEIYCISKLTLYISTAIASQGILLLPWSLSHLKGQSYY